jgi:hypothetical protein
MIAAFLTGVHFGVVGLSAAWAIAYPLMFLMQLRTWLPYAGIDIARLFWIVGKSAVASAAMILVVSLARTIAPAGSLHGLLTLTAIGAVTYIVFSLAVNREAIADIRALLRKARRPQPLPEPELGR